MRHEPASPDINPLLVSETPPISSELKRALTLESLRVKTIEIFDPENINAIIAKHEGQLVTGIDIGGDKVARRKFRVKSGVLTSVSETDTEKGSDGDTYLNFLRTSEQTPFIGISCAGILDGTILADSPNARTFTSQLRKQFGGDFARLFPASRVVLNNDAVAGVKSTGLEAFKRNPNVKNVLFVIDGKGFGLAVLTKDVSSDEWHILASEPGHLIAPDDLNPFHRIEPCGVNGATYTCIERIAASGAGVEGTYRQITGKRLDGREISALYQQGNEFAANLYNASAVALAQTIALEESALRLKPRETTIVYHGGGFEVPAFAQRVTRLLETYIGQPHATFKSRDAFENAELTGAAIAALTAK